MLLKLHCNKNLSIFLSSITVVTRNECIDSVLTLQSFVVLAFNLLQILLSSKQHRKRVRDVCVIFFPANKYINKLSHDAQIKDFMGQVT